MHVPKAHEGFRYRRKEDIFSINAINLYFFGTIEEDAKMGSNKKSFGTITGQYLLIENPCTTVPCLPGMAYAVLANGKYYYITIDGHWFSHYCTSVEILINPYEPLAHA